MTKFLTVLIVSFLFTLKTFASPQLPDYIIYKGDTLATYSLILEQYFHLQAKEDQGKLFGLSFRDGADFNCWRGYQAIYEIENDSLFLVAVISCGERRNGKIDKVASADKIKSIFKNKFLNDKVYIDWFSGDLKFPLTKNVLRWDGVFYKIYEKETVIDIVFGKVLKINNVDNYVDNPKLIDRKSKDRISDILFKKIKKAKWINVDSIDCSEKYLITIGNDGKISKVTMLGYESQDSIDKYWERNEYDYCVKTILSSLRKLQFDILKDKGNPISEDIYIELWFDGKNGKIENWTN